MPPCRANSEYTDQYSSIVACIICKAPDLPSTIAENFSIFFSAASSHICTEPTLQPDLELESRRLVCALVNQRPAEINLPLFYCESTLKQGRSQRHRAVSALLVGGEKSRLTPPISNYTPKVSTVRTNPSSWLLIPCNWLIA